MTVCPVCEHAQSEGDSCVVCGRALQPPAAAAPTETPPVEGLEPTRLEAGAAAGADAPLLDGLEPTRLGGADAAAPPAAAPFDLEPTGHPRGEAVPRDPLAPELCRYCRTAAAPGEVFCERCGMRLARPGRPGR